MLGTLARRIFRILFGLVLPIGLVTMLVKGFVPGLLTTWAIPVAGMTVSWGMYELALKTKQA